MALANWITAKPLRNRCCELLMLSYALDLLGMQFGSSRLEGNGQQAHDVMAVNRRGNVL